MRLKFLYAVLPSLLVFSSACPAAGFFLPERPFQVRADLVLATSGEQPMARAIRSDIERYLTEMDDYSGAVKPEDEKRQGKRNELQYRSLRLSISRWRDWPVRKDAARLADEKNPWEMMKNFTSGFGSAPDRDTLETMGKIFTPQIDLGIEF
jgi:predicted DNA-binding protein